MYILIVLFLIVSLVFLQSMIFPDKNQGGRSFYSQAVMSAMSIPQVKLYACKYFLCRQSRSLRPMASVGSNPDSV